LSRDFGFDGVFETNHLGHFLLTKLLRPRMSATGRVLTVSSDMHQPPGPALRWPGVEKIAYPNSSPAISAQRYSYSKLCNLYFAQVPAPIAAAMRTMFSSRLGNLDASSAALAPRGERARAMGLQRTSR
jgi:NAD(P)-dependent dehydrogenase (short-subunit alcohol dehydrogenase family)